jgi:hypothetical protein
MLVLVFFLLIRNALFKSAVHFCLLAGNTAVAILLFVFSLTTFLSTGSEIFNNMLPVLVAMVEMVCILVFLRHYLDAFYSELGFAKISFSFCLFTLAFEARYLERVALGFECCLWFVLCGSCRIWGCCLLGGWMEPDGSIADK